MTPTVISTLTCLGDKGTSDPVEAPGDPDVVIREPEQTAVKTPVRGTLLAAKPLTMEDQETAETPLSEAAVTAVTLKDSAGRVYFDSSAARDRRSQRETGHRGRH